MEGAPLILETFTIFSIREVMAHEKLLNMSIRVQFEVKPILEQKIILGNQLLLLDSLLQERQVWIAICCVLFGQGRARGKDGFGE